MKKDITPFMALGSIFFDTGDSFVCFCKEGEIFTAHDCDGDPSSVELMIIRKNRKTKRKSTKKITLLRTEFEGLKRLRLHSNYYNGYEVA